MRYSRPLLPTFEEAPADATSQSRVLLLRGGYVRRVGTGIALRVRELSAQTGTKAS